MKVAVVGAGVTGLVTATELVDRGHTVEVFERAPDIGARTCSWYAGGMLAPWCERESAEAEVVTLGENSKQWWSAHIDRVYPNGTLVVAPGRDRRELDRFARLTERHQRLDGDAIAALEPTLEGRFSTGLHFPGEAHVEPRQALPQLAKRLADRSTPVRFDRPVTVDDLDADRVIDCRGFAARDDLASLRGVRGEMLVLRSDEIRLSRPIRVLHPRIPVYVVPWSDGLFMVGATMIENDQRGRVTARSVHDLISAAYSLHPAFGEAELVETGVDVRPAFPDNLPRVVNAGRILRVNGMYRHGFLLGPAMAMQVARHLDEQATPRRASA